MAVAAVFDLGRPLGPLTPVPGGHSHRMWRLDTEIGSYAVKEMNRLDSPEWLPWLRAAWRFERAAWAAGVSMPEPVIAPGGDVVTEVPVEGGPAATVRVHHWVVAEPVSQPVRPEVGRWAGSTMAELHRLSMPPEPRWAFPLGAGDQAELWPLLVEQAKVAHAPWTEDLAALSATVKEIYRLVTVEAAGRDLPEVIGHSDLRAKNILVGEAGPVLVDWDLACARVPREELAGTALSLAGWNRLEGLVEETARGVIEGYRCNFGELDEPLSAIDAAGDLGNEVDWVASVARRALGDGAHGPDDVARCREILPGLIAALPHKLSAAQQLPRLSTQRVCW
ncbi:phosphotransferase [Crossiella equi]|nr:phosphotransferase [Crossiella equi]